MESRLRSWLWLSGVVVAVAIACEGKHREFAPATTDDGALMPAGMGGGDVYPDSGLDNELAPNLGGVGGSEPSLAPGSLGAACSGNADCDEPNVCVDGVCCSSACVEICADCNVPGSLGTCSAAPSDPACPSLNCAGQSTDCRKVDTTQLALNCESFGVCRVDAECAVLFESAGTACAGNTGTCDGAGACVVPDKLALGEPCAADADCAEGHCVPSGSGGGSICCDSACDGLCQMCGADGHCDDTPANDERCPAVACSEDNVCRDYEDGLAAGACRSFAQCQTGVDCDFVELRASAQCACDADNACRLLVGAACNDDAECSSGACLATVSGARVCCANRCGSGLSCSTSGMACVACEGAAIECDGNVEKRCNAGTVGTVTCRNGCTPGLGCNAEPPVGFPCDGGRCAAPAVCQDDTNGDPRCCSRDCEAEGKVCSENGSCVCTERQIQSGDDCLLQDGDPCEEDGQCQQGSFCTDGVCCSEACEGACERCQPGTGLCIAVPQGQQDSQCTSGRQCMGARGDCRLSAKQPCSAGSACASGNCEATTGNGPAICCAQNCTGMRGFCRSDGNACVQCESNADCGNGCNSSTGLCNALLPIGSTCGSSSQCSSGGVCLLDQKGETRCCERNCAADGLVCNGAGRCVALPPPALVTLGAPAAFVRTLVDELAASPRTWSVQNTGGSPTPPLQLSNTNAAEFQVTGSCIQQVLQPGASCSLSITFTPRSPGTRRATLSLQGGPSLTVSVNVEGPARLRDGSPCTANGPLDCDSNRCTEWYVDADGDGFGSLEFVGGHPSVLICGDGAAANRPPPFLFVDGCRGNDVELPYVTDPIGRTDCCDNLVSCAGLATVSSAEAFPGRTTGFSSLAGANCGPGVFTFDFNCDGRAEVVNQVELRPACAAAPSAISAAACSARSGFVEPLECGVISRPQGCALSDGTCVGVAVGDQVIPECL